MTADPSKELAGLVTRYPKTSFRVAGVVIAIVMLGGGAWMSAAYAQFLTTRADVTVLRESFAQHLTAHTQALASISERLAVIEQNRQEARTDIKELREDVKMLLRRGR